jgi:hypothetical protein
MYYRYFVVFEWILNKELWRTVGWIQLSQGWVVSQHGNELPGYDVGNVLAIWVSRFKNGFADSPELIGHCDALAGICIGNCSNIYTAGKKLKGELFLRLTKDNAMKTYGGKDVSIYIGTVGKVVPVLN